MSKSSGLIHVMAVGIATFALFGKSEAEALTTWRNFAPSLCVAESGAQPTLSSYGQAFNASASVAQWICPVVSDSTLQARNSTKTQLWGYANQNCTGSGPVSVAMCRTYYTGGGGTCSSSVNPGANNTNFTLQMTPGSSWTAAAYPDSYFFAVQIGGTCSGSNAVVFGYDYET